MRSALMAKVVISIQIWSTMMRETSVRSETLIGSMMRHRARAVRSAMVSEVVVVVRHFIARATA